MPAILKGFCDRVFSSGWAYTYPQLKGRLINWSGLILSNIPIVRNWFRRYIVLGRLRAKQFSIIRTYGGPVTTSKIFGSTHGLLENGILRFCGASRIKVLEIENTDRSFFNKTEFLKAMQSVRTLIHKSISLKSN
jgi:putative NADPH-quinone reductase